MWKALPLLSPILWRHACEKWKALKNVKEIRRWLILKRQKQGQPPSFYPPCKMALVLFFFSSCLWGVIAVCVVWKRRRVHVFNHRVLCEKRGVCVQWWICACKGKRVCEAVCSRRGIWPTDWEQLVRKRNNEATAPFLSSFFSFTSFLSLFPFSKMGIFKFLFLFPSALKHSFFLPFIVSVSKDSCLLFLFQFFLTHVLNVVADAHAEVR